MTKSEHFLDRFWTGNWKNRAPLGYSGKSASGAEKKHKKTRGILGQILAEHEKSNFFVISVTFGRL